MCFVYGVYITVSDRASAVSLESDLEESLASGQGVMVYTVGAFLPYGLGVGSVCKVWRRLWVVIHAVVGETAQRPQRNT